MRNVKQVTKVALAAMLVASAAAAQAQSTVSYGRVTAEVKLNPVSCVVGRAKRGGSTETDEAFDRAERRVRLLCAD